MSKVKSPGYFLIYFLFTLCWCTLETTPAYEDSVRGIGSSADGEGYEIASEILRNSLNFSVNPCEDFYEFTCGKWIASHPIPENKPRYGHLEIASDKLQKKMRDLFESNDVTEPKAVSALKAFYKKCMDENELNRTGAKRLIENVKGFGVWPALEGDDMWKAENYNLTSLLIHVYRRRAVLAFIDFKRPYRTDVRLLIQIELFQKDGGLPTNITKTKKDVDEIIDLEMKMVEILDADVNITGPQAYHLRDMQELMPLVNWSQFFSAVAPYNCQNYLYSDPKIVLVDLDYINKVKELLQTMDSRIITNYVFMLFSRKWSGEMGEKYENVEQEYNKVMYGQRQKTPRWQFCTRIAMEKMSDATTALYVKKALHKTTKEDTLEIANALKEAFRKLLNTSEWIYDETRDEALDKLDHMIRQIAYPKFILEGERLDNYYSNLDVRDDDTFSEMVEKVIQWQTERFFEELRTVQDRFVIFNTADFTAAALNYGGIGAIVGHEMTHAFDDEGRSFDAFGKRFSWWNEDIKKEYEQRSQCLIDQYGEIEVPGTGYKIDGKKTLGENIADLGGVKLAYMHGGEEDRIKGLEQFDNKQMFFLGYATILCRNTNNSMVNRILNDEHAPARYRVNQVLANQPEFAAAFHCEMDSAMNPTNRCEFW